MSNPVGWFEIYVSDMQRARTFYQKVLGKTLDDMAVEGMGDMQMVAFPMAMDAPGASGALVRMEGFPAGGNSTLVYFSCDDVSAEAARIADAGGRVQQEKTAIGPYGFIALGVDTEGNMFGLHSLQ